MIDIFFLNVYLNCNIDNKYNGNFKMEDNKIVNIVVYDIKMEEYFIFLF